jgi:hypothetical protein
MELEISTLEQSPPSRTRLDSLRIDRGRLAVGVELQETTETELVECDEEMEREAAEYATAIDRYNETLALKRDALTVLTERERDALTESKRRHGENLREETAAAWEDLDRHWTGAMVALERVMTLHKTGVVNKLCEDTVYAGNGAPPYVFLNLRRYLDRLKDAGLLERTTTLSGDDSPQDVREFQAGRY